MTKLIIATLLAANIYQFIRPQMVSDDAVVASKVYYDLYHYREHLTAYKAKYKRGELSYKDYPKHEFKRNSLVLKYGHCAKVMNWVEKGETMVRALNSNSNINNDFIYAVYWAKLINIARGCK